MTSKRILVAEDEVVLGLFYKQYFMEQKDYELVDVVKTGKEVVQLALKEQPDLIIMDIQLRDGKTGIEASQEILDQIDVPILYCTAYSDRETIQQASHSKHEGFVFKPISEEQLTRAIKEIFSAKPRSA
jgi:two-component system, response regulator PdtaR